MCVIMKIYSEKCQRMREEIKVKLKSNASSINNLKKTYFRFWLEYCISLNNNNSMSYFQHAHDLREFHFQSCPMNESMVFIQKSLVCCSICKTTSWDSLNKKIIFFFPQQQQQSIERNVTSNKFVCSSLRQTEE